MSAQSEPEKYSIDEMMDRLKNRPAEEPLQDGELVTRSDGSQAIRVRKRKRRSHQPHKEEIKGNRRARMLQVSGALVLILLAAFAAGVAMVYANSAPFRTGLIQKIAASTGAAVELRQFRMNPTSANAGMLTLTWPEGNALRELSLRGFRAEVFPASFLGKSMVGEEVVFGEGTLSLRVPVAGEPRRESPAPDATPAIRFKRYAVPKLHMIVGDPSAPWIQMRNTEGSFQPVSPVGRAQLLLNRGEVSIKGWPKLRMNRSHIEFRDTEVDVVGMRLLHETDARGVFEMSGTVSPYSPDRASTLAIHMESFLFSGLVGEEVGRLFSGRVDTMDSAKSNYLSFSPSATPNASMAVSLRGSLTSSFEINGFPFLTVLSQALDDKWFLAPTFEGDVTGSLRRADGAVAFSEMSFENKDRMALRGGISLAADRRLSGNLEVGVAEAMILASKNRRLEAMFSPTREGFRWVTLTIGGTSSNPTDDFRVIYESTETAEKQAPSREVPSFEELTRPE
jgi:hypothetical protein